MTKDKAGLDIDLRLSEIKELLCDNCSVKLRSLIKDRITDEMVDQVLADID